MFFFALPFFTFFFQVSLTANVVLQRPTDDFDPDRKRKGPMQYSVYYGETFDCEGSCSHQAKAVTENYYMSDAGDVARFPRVITEQEVTEQFEHIFDDSAASVHSLINYVILFRRSVETPKYRRRRSRKGHTYSIQI